jgi:hypothetical protein
MKNSVRFVVAGLMLAGFATAQAQVQTPSSGASDLWLFVSDQQAGTSFAEDTGISLSSLMPSNQLAAANSNTVLSTAINASINLGPTAALTSYTNSANSAGQTLEWAVLGAQFPGQTNNSSIKGVGKDLTIFSAPSSAGPNIGNNYILSTLANIGSPFDGDVTYLAKTYTAGGQTYAFSAGTAGGNVWGASTGGNGGSTNLYAQLPDQSGIGLGTSVSLYGATGNGNTGNVQSYILGTNLTLSSTGTLTVGSTSPVPLPAAVWLFGSGLLGLIGVGRRRAAAAA